MHTYPYPHQPTFYQSWNVWSLFLGTLFVVTSLLESSFEALLPPLHVMYPQWEQPLHLPIRPDVEQKPDPTNLLNPKFDDVDEILFET